MRRDHGFTLIEMVVVMLVISAGLLGLASLFSGNIKALVINEGVQQVAQYAQECAERVLAVRRDLGFGSSTISTSMCDSTSLGALPSGFTRSVGVPPATVTGSGTSACPSGITCRDVTVTVSNGTVSSVINVMLVNY